MFPGPFAPLATVWKAPPMPVARALAHQGGWDEILMVVAPLALFWFLLRLANRRAAADPHGPDDPGDASRPGPPPT